MISALERNSLLMCSTTDKKLEVQKGQVTFSGSLNSLVIALMILFLSEKSYLIIEEVRGTRQRLQGDYVCNSMFNPKFPVWS